MFVRNVPMISLSCVLGFESQYFLLHIKAAWNFVNSSARNSSRAAQNKQEKMWELNLHVHGKQQKKKREPNAHVHVCIINGTLEERVVQFSCGYNAN